MHDQLRHRRIVVVGGREVEVGRDSVALGREQVPGSVVREFAQDLVTDRSHSVRCLGSGDQILDRTLVGGGQSIPPADAGRCGIH